MKVLVAHPAQQHSYRLAEALKKEHLLGKYVTTVYYKKFSLTHFVSVLLKGNFKTKAQGRRCECLDDQEVVQFCEGEGLLKLLALNTPILKKKYNVIKYHTADRFAKKVAKYAIKNHFDAVVTYDNTSPLLFEILEREAPDILRIMDVSAANPFYMRSIYERDFELAPSFCEKLKKERQIVWDQTICDRTEREYRSTQMFLVPSAFVAESLRFSGITQEQMLICPYGVDNEAFTPKTYSDINGKQPLRFVYVGGVKELKGIYYLLEAFRKIPKEKARLTVVGNADINSRELQPYIDTVHFTNSVLHSEIPSILKQADVFIFPSLGEGLSLSVLEAASCGLPLIISENSGVADMINDGQEGFTIPIQSIDAILEKVNWFADHRDQIPVMGRAAASFASKYTWEAYYQRMAAIFKKIHSETGE